MSRDGIHCLVFSKDRAMQLDAFLRSAKRYAPYSVVRVLGHDAWDDDPAYHSVIGTHSPFASFVSDRSFGFEGQVRAWLTNERVVFHTDDDVFFRSAHDWMTWDRPTSYRLGLNTTYQHPAQRFQVAPQWYDEMEKEAAIRWRWRDEEGDFGYPLSLNATVYRSEWLLPLLDFPFTNPTELEAGLAARAGRFEPQWMTAPLHSCCVSLPHNRVSASSGNPISGVPEWSADALCDMYLDGWRIDLDAMDFSKVTAAHQEIPLKFYKP